MRTTFKSRNVHTAMPKLARALLDAPIVGSRNGEARELLGVRIELERPWERFSLVPGRSLSPAALIAETFWVLAGRNDTEWLSRYLPRANEFSDDGKTWRAGYGPRLRAWPINKMIDGDLARRHFDQLPEVCRILRADPLSRRAVISLWDPARDLMADSKDLPCNDLIQFLVRDGLLHMHVHTRSNDFIWGWSGINTFEWSCLQEMVANSLDVHLGPVVYSIGSFHLYERHYSKAQKMVERYGLDEYPENDLSPTGFDFYVERDGVRLESFFNMEYYLRSNPEYAGELPRHCDLELLPWLYAIDIFWRVQNNDFGEPRDLNERIQSLVGSNPDIGNAIREWVTRTFRESPERCDISIDWEGPDPVESQANPEWRTVLGNLRDLEEAKSITYGNSWKKYGEASSIFPNLARKYDRLETLWNKQDDALEESIIDTLADLAVYAMKWIGYLEDPEIDTGIEPALRWLASSPAFEIFGGYNGDPNTLTASNRMAGMKRLFTTIEHYMNVPGSKPGVSEAYGKDEVLMEMVRSCIAWLATSIGYTKWDQFTQMVARLKEATSAIGSR